MHLPKLDTHTHTYAHTYLCINAHIQSHRDVHMDIWAAGPHHGRMPVDHKRALLKSFAGFGNLLSKQSRVWAALPSTCALLLPGWSLGLARAALPSCPAHKWHISHSGWSQRSTCTSQRGDRTVTWTGGCAWIQASMPRTVCVCLCVFLGAGDVLPGATRASQSTWPFTRLCWAWSCFTGAASPPHVWAGESERQ